MATRSDWTGTAIEMLHSFANDVDEVTLRTPAWPKSARGLRGSESTRASASVCWYSVERGRTYRNKAPTLCKAPIQMAESAGNATSAGGSWLRRTNEDKRRAVTLLLNDGVVRLVGPGDCEAVCAVSKDKNEYERNFQKIFGRQIDLF